MRSDASAGTQRVCGNSRTRKTKKKANHKTKRSSDYKRPTLLLHRIREAPGKRLRKKPCTKCGEVKWLGQFSMNFKPGRGISYRSECILCKRKSEMEGHQRKRKKAIWRKSHEQDSARQAYRRDYYYSHQKEFKEYRRQFRERNPDYFRQKSREREAKVRTAKQMAREAVNDKDCR